MNRDAVLAAIAGQPFDTDVQVNVRGFLIDLIAIEFDWRRQAIVVELAGDDVNEVLCRLAAAHAQSSAANFFVAGPGHIGGGNTL